MVYNEKYATVVAVFYITRAENYMKLQNYCKKLLLSFKEIHMKNTL